MNKRVSTIVTEYILGKLKDATYKEGDKLPSERELMEILEVGRSSVRESLNTLVDMNILEKKMGIGVFVKKTEVNQLVDSYVVGALLENKVSKELLEFRLMIEVEICGKAAQVASKESLIKMEEAIHVHRDVLKKNASTLEADLAFHQAIVEAAGNYVLKKVYNSIADLLTSIRQELLQSEDKEKSLMFHEKIYEAIKSKNVELARELMREHLLDVAYDYDQLNFKNGKGR